MLMLHSYVVLSGKKVRRMLFAGKATFSQACLEFKSTLPAGIPRMSRLPLHALQGFVAAARIGTLSRAAESLNFTVTEFGRASCMVRVFPYVLLSLFALSFKQ